uniref:Uncharacterized protein n=1 Tax=Picea glauca TaxID=3330 RepID=A0A101LYZ9_PICGL|nr:hypothetical protein ABT39_MTgene3597 [Picea glauca]KUM47803.1 hypothetical protein ABT39_MTgene4797 [Picea glauca]KUM47814.1 hypothetical protein ABT39_MTgene4808 [Picea glauca]
MLAPTPWGRVELIGHGRFGKSKWWFRDFRQSQVRSARKAAPCQSFHTTELVPTGSSVIFLN